MVISSPVSRVVELPAEGRLIVVTDLQGNVRDFDAVEAVYERAAREPGGAFLVVTGDLVHGPEIPKEHWPPHLGTFYHGDSPTLLERARALEARHPGRVHFLIGNHEHAHIGGPVVSKFFPNEAERLEELLGPSRAEAFKTWMVQWPFVAIAPSAGICMMHAAPHVAIEGRGDLDRLPLIVTDEDDLELEDRSTIVALLWARSTSTERARAFLRAVDPRLMVAVYGHDVAHTGYAIDREPLLCISSSFGCFDGDKLYLDWDLSDFAESANEVAERGLRPLYPNATPIHRR
ncbi:MAG: metallophosphoesterase [Polyangiaceae bacterium]|nr:metallophosphoesterase [Polyangiaceae bacterium]